MLAPMIIDPPVLYPGTPVVLGLMGQTFQNLTARPDCVLIQVEARYVFRHYIARGKELGRTFRATTYKAGA
jgi:hypothetical protein